MKTSAALLALALSCLAAHEPIIPAGSAIYVDPQNGMDKFFQTAFQKQHVPLRVVSTPEKADYTFDSTVFPVWNVVQNRYGGKVGDTSEAAAKLTSKSGEIIWRYAVSQKTLKRGGQAVADDCAKHLKPLVGNVAHP